MRIRLAIVCAVVCCCFVASAQTLDLKSLKAKAESGDAKAQLALAQAYEKGDGVPQDNDLAAKWMRAAAEQGDPQGQNELGILYRRGIGVPEDKAQAFQWYAKSAAQGYGPARFNLAASYYNGDGVAIDDTLAYAWFRLAAASGSKEAAEAVTRMEAELSPIRLDGAKLVLANMMLSGKQISKDLAAGFALTREVADHGDREAQFNTGRMFAEGFGTAPNPSLALKYLADSGRYEALDYMADMYLRGKGIPPDPKKAVEILEKAAVSSKESRLKLAGLYWEGDGVPQDHKKAMKHYTYPTLAGNPTALYRSGLAYRNGFAVKKNDATACMYFVVAANMGSVEALQVVHPACPGEKLEAAKKKAADFIRTYRLQVKPISSSAR